MKIVINQCYGGFDLSENFEKFFNYDWLDTDSKEFRINPALIKAVEEDSASVGAEYSKLKVVEIPDNATDWEIQEYDGLENLIYVVDGKIHHCH